MSLRMHFLAGGRLRMRRSVFVPEAAREDLIELPVICVLLRHAQGNVLFDTGCHPDMAARLGAAARALQPISAPTDNVVDSLRSAGLAPGDIDLVVNSHFHTDHCGCNAFFPRARVICHAAELAAVRSVPGDGAGYYRADWDPGDDGAGFQTIDTQHDVFGDGRIVLLPLPGHSPGTLGALVDLDRDGRHLLAADTVPLRENLDRETVPRNTWNPEALARAYAEVKRIAASGATVICGHDDGQWQALRKGAENYQ